MNIVPRGQQLCHHAAQASPSCLIQKSTDWISISEKGGDGLWVDYAEGEEFFGIAAHIIKVPCLLPQILARTTRSSPPCNHTSPYLGKIATLPTSPALILNIPSCKSSFNVTNFLSIPLTQFSISNNYNWLYLFFIHSFFLRSFEVSWTWPPPTNQPTTTIIYTPTRDLRSVQHALCLLCWIRHLLVHKHIPLHSLVLHVALKTKTKVKSTTL